jgi:hypothetical protein
MNANEEWPALGRGSTHRAPRGAGRLLHHMDAHAEDIREDRERAEEICDTDSGSISPGAREDQRHAESEGDHHPGRFREGTPKAKDAANKGGHCL